MIDIKINNKLLSMPCRKVKEDELEHALQLGQAMIKYLDSTDNGIGLAANQVGYDLAIVVTKVKGDVIWINPEVVIGEGEVESRESCLSFPNKTALVKRYKHFTIKSKYFANGKWNDGKVYFYAPNVGDSPIRRDDFLECVCIQHELDHLNGITMIDKRIDTTVKESSKIGRNEKVTIINTNGETKTVKYKKAEILISKGWELV